jgi:O-antigen/teichoic acid export membrane protein
MVLQYGFPYSATQAIARAHGDIEETSSIFWSVQGAKLCMLMLSALTLLGMTTYFTTCRLYSSALWHYFALIAAAALFPSWFFQGKEKMGIIAGLNLAKKAIFLLWLFSFVRSSADFYLYLRMLAFFEVSRLIAAHILIFWKHNLRWKQPHPLSLWLHARSGFAPFIANLSINSYTRLPALLLAYYSGPQSVGVYAVGVRICRSILGMTEPLIQAAFPWMSRAWSENAPYARAVGGRFLMVSAFVYGLMSILLFFAADPITTLLTGGAAPAAASVMRMTSTIPLAAIISNVYGLEFLVPMGRARIYSLTMALGFPLCLILHLALVPALGTLGSSGALLLTEWSITCVMGYAAHRILRTKPFVK